MQVLLNEFHSKLTSDHLNKTSVFENDLLSLYGQIIEGLSNNYEESRTYIRKFLASLEQNHSSSISIELVVFLNKMADLQEAKSFPIST